jgi:predicted small lipoprotein YifL
MNRTVRITLACVSLLAVTACGTSGSSPADEHATINRMQSSMSAREKSAIEDSCRKETSNRISGTVSFSEVAKAHRECVIARSR